MILLGIDYGTKRIGLASGDTSHGMAFPLRSIDAGPDATTEIAAFAASEGAERIVVGIPYRLSGEGDAGETQEAAQRFVAALKEKTTIMVDTEDERLTSAYADSIREQSGTKQKDFDRDAVAAAAILETYMARITRAEEHRG